MYVRYVVTCDGNRTVCMRTRSQEIYEVDASREPEGSKDRHDHVVRRGLARRRLESIAALPGQPFQFIVNFQIPGDPPVRDICMTIRLSEYK